MNVFSDYIPNKLITIDDKDPPWMNDKIKYKINKRDILYEQLKKYKSNLTDFDVMNELTSGLSSILSQRREEYYFQHAKKLNDPSKNAKTCWSILKTVFNDRKILVIPPLLTDGRLASDFEEKANRFNFLVVGVHFKENIHKILWRCLLLPVWNAVVNMG